MKRKVKWFATPVLIITIVVLLINMANHSKHSFSIDHWKNIEKRMVIVNSLLQDTILTGMTHDEIISLLGPPSKELDTDIWIYDLDVQVEGGTLQIIPTLRLDFVDGLVENYEVESNA